MNRRSLSLLWRSALLALLCAFAHLSLAQDDPFQKATQAYQQGHPEEAVSQYESLLKSGVEDAALYFNLGNAYAAQGLLGKAILSYLRALRLDPGAEDIRANLLTARRAAAEGAEPPRVGPLLRLREDELGGDKTPLALSSRAFVCYAVCAAFACAALLAHRRKRATLTRALALISGGLLLLSTFFAVVAWQSARAASHETRAVVLAPNTAVRRGPIDDAESLFLLPAGEIVSLEERREQWGLIRIPERPDGWVLLSQVEPVLR